MTDQIPPWESRIVGYGEADPATLKAHELNWREHPAFQREALMAALNEVGWIQNVIINKTTGRIVDGHLRVDLAIEKGYPKVPITYVELDPAQEAAALASYDAITILAGLNESRFESLMEEVQTSNETLGALFEAARESHAALEGIGDRFLDVSQDQDSPAEDDDDAKAEGEEMAAAVTNLDPGEDRYKEQYGVIVICDGEASQQKIYNELVQRGYNVRVVVT